MTIPVFAGTGTFSSTDTDGANITPPLPPGVNPDDILILAVSTNGSNGFPTISGWTEFGTAVTDTNHSSAWYWRRHVAGDTAPTFTKASGDALSAGVIGLFGVIYGFRGCVTSGTPFEDVTHAGLTSSSTPAGAEITTTGVDRLAVSIVVGDNDPTWSSGFPPTGWDQLDSRTSLTGLDQIAAAISKDVPTATTVTAPTIGTTSISLYWRSVTLAFISDGVAGPLFMDGGSTDPATTGNTAPGLPAGWHADDVWLMAVMTNASNTFPTISGWTNLGVDVDSANQSTGWYWRRAVAGDAAPSFTIAGGTALSSTNVLVARIYGLRGCKTTGDPFEDVTMVGTPTSTSTPASSVVTASVANTLVLAVALLDDNNTTTDFPPTGWQIAGGEAGDNTGGDWDFVAIHKKRTATGDESAVNILTSSAADYARTLTAVFLPSASSTNAAATEATSTGTGFAAALLIGAAAAVASVTGTAHDATVTTSSGTNASATVAESTGTAHFDAGSSINVELSADNPIELVASAYTVTVTVKPNAGAGSATGTAHDATVTTGAFSSPDAGVAASTGTANNGSGSVAPNSGPATVTGTAHDATVQTGAFTNASATVATATATANNATTTTKPNATAATATGTAYNATVTVPGATNAAATVATATATAFNVTDSPVVTVDIAPSRRSYVIDNRRTYRKQARRR